MAGEALDDRSGQQRERRIAVARVNSWQQRAEQLSLHLEQALGRLAVA